jgi:hypothetical protein
MTTMTKRISSRFGIAAIAAALFAPTALAQAEQTPPPQQPAQAQPAQDSVADAARKAKADKAAKPKKVFTDEDVSSLKGGGLSVVGEQTSAVPAAEEGKPGAKPSAEAPKGVKDEAYWRGRAQKIHSQMADLDKQINTLQDDMKKGGNLAVDPKSGLNQNVIYFEDRSAKLKALQKQRDELQKQMDALEEEARRADVPIGWLR